MADVTPEQWDQMLQAHNAWAASVVEAGATIHGGDALAPSSTATTVRTGGATPGRHRRPVRRDQGGARRLLPRRVRRPRPGARARAHPAREHRRGPSCHRHELTGGTGATAVADDRRRRARRRAGAPQRVGTRPRRGGPPARRRPRRPPRSARRRPSRRRCAPGASAASRPDPARGSPRRRRTARWTGCAARPRCGARYPDLRARRGRARAGGGRRAGRRPAAAGVHLLPPGARRPRRASRSRCG